MKVLCPTCNGKGSIPDPKNLGVVMNKQEQIAKARADWERAVLSDEEEG